MRAVVLAAALIACGAAPVRAQQPAAPWVPIGSRLDRDVRWAIDAGALRLNPLVRPFRLAAVRAAVTAARQRSLPDRPQRALDVVAQAVEAMGDSTALLVEAALSGYRNARRESFRSGGGSGLSPGLAFWASAATGPLVAVLNPALDERLRDDPEFTGAKTKRVIGRIQTAYVAATGRPGDLFLGRQAHNWGPDLFDGLLLSGDAYAFDELAGAFRFGRFELTALTRRLSSIHDTTGAGIDFNRFFFAHRLDIRLGDDAWLGLVETGIYGGRGQGFQLALMAPVNLGLASDFNDSLHLNSMLGAELSLPLATGLRAEASGFLDDIQIDNSVLTDQRPTSYGLTLAARWAWPRAPVHSSLGYTRVSALSYRNSFEPAYEYSNQHVGLGRNFSDYDQILLRTQVRPHPSWDLVVDVSYFRQGSADFRQPFPNDSVLATPGQGFLVAPVERWAAARVAIDGEPWTGIGLTSELGFTRGINGGTTAIASFRARIGFDVLHRRMGLSYPGIERGADRPWP